MLQYATVVKRSEPSVWLKQAGLLTTIPVVLLVGPAIGYYLGIALDQRWAHAPYGMVGGVIVGLLTGAHVTVQLIQQARRLDQDD